jgi:hypothetical protein
MGRPCSICERSDLAEIDEALAAGVPAREIAHRFRTTRWSIDRHLANHVSPALRRLLPGRQAQREVAIAAGRTLSLLDRVEAHLAGVEEIYRRAQEGDKLSLALQATDRVERLLRLIAQLRGELRPQGTVVNVLNLQTSPEWLQVRARLLAALEPFPEARASVAQALSDLDQPRALPA